MKEAFAKSCKDFLKSNAEQLADAAAVAYDAAECSDPKTLCHVAISIAMVAFKAGWNAAIDYCMQPVEKEVPAEAATSDEHTNNTCEPILSGREDEVNDC